MAKRIVATKPVLKVKNWEEFQHYRDRRPPWIKLHRQILDDGVFQSMSDASKALAPMLWLIASEDEKGEIPADFMEFKGLPWRLRMTQTKLLTCLKELIDKGFIVDESASVMLAMRLHDARPEESREETYKEERETEPQETEKHAPPALSHPLLDIWQEERGTLPEVRTFGKDRLGRCRLRAKAHVTNPERFLDDFRLAVQTAAQTPFLQGVNNTGWIATFDWFIAADSNYSKVLEGKYSGSAQAGGNRGTDIERSIAESIELGKEYGIGAGDHQVGHALGRTLQPERAITTTRKEGLH